MGYFEIGGLAAIRVYSSGIDYYTEGKGLIEIDFL